MKFQVKTINKHDDIKPLARRGHAKRNFTLILLVIFFVLTSFGIYKISLWFDTHKVVFNQPVKVAFKAPVEIKERKPLIIREKIALDYPEEIDTPIEKYICEKFGTFDCKTALAIVKAESGFNDQAFNANSNDSVDLGCWQINFPTHIKTISPKDALDCYKATDWAYAKYKRDGNFNAWVAFTSGSYLARLEK